MTKIAIIGGGNMGGAIARALTQNSLISEVRVSDINENTLRSLQNFNNSIKVTTSNEENVKGADIVLLAVKPWLAESVIEEIKDAMDYSKQIFISIVAGVPFEKLCSYLYEEAALPPMFRMIPNTAIDVLQQGVLCTGERPQRLYVSIKLWYSIRIPLYKGGCGGRCGDGRISASGKAGGYSDSAWRH